MIVDALIVALVLFIASITLAIHLGRRHAPGRHAETPGQEWDEASLAALPKWQSVVGHGGRNIWCQRCEVHHPPDGIPCTAERPRARMLGAPPALTVELPAYRQSVPRAEAAGPPPWPVQGTICPADWGSATESQRCTWLEGHGEWHRDRSGREWTDSGNTRAHVMSSSPGHDRAAAPAPVTVWTPGRIRVCEVPGCPARQSHATEGHARWLGMVGVLVLAAREPEPVPDFRLPAWDPPAVGLPKVITDVLGAETVTGAMRQIFTEAPSA